MDEPQDEGTKDLFAALAEAALLARYKANIGMLSERVETWRKALDAGNYDEFPLAFIILDVEDGAAECNDPDHAHLGVYVGGKLNPAAVPDLLMQLAEDMRRHATAGLN